MRIDADAKDSLDQFEINLASELRIKVTHSDAIRALVAAGKADMQSVIHYYREITGVELCNNVSHYGSQCLPV